MTGRRRFAAGLTLIVAIGVVIAIILITSSPSSAPASSGSSRASGAATVERRTLVETDTESGTLSYAGAQTVYDRLSGTVTWLPAVGQLIKPGQALFDVDNKPVLLMDGSTPAFRNLTPKDSDGPDIEELNANLVKLGFDADGIVVDDVWQAATTVGVEELQDSLGMDATGKLTLGRVVFLPGAQLISTVDGTVGASGGSGTAASLTDVQPHSEFVDLTTTTQTGTTPTTTPATTTPTTTTTTATSTTPTTTSTGKGHKKQKTGLSPQQQVAALLAILRAEIAQLHSQQGGSPGGSHSPSQGSSSPGSSTPAKSSKSGGSTGGSTGGGNSGGGGGGAAILQTTSNHLIVTVDLAATSQSEAVVGGKVVVEMPNNTNMNGVITAVSSVAQTSSGSGNGNGNGGGGGGGGGSGGSGNSGSTATVPVTIKLLGKVSGVGLDQAAVSVNFAEAKATNVLSVPVTALVATSGNTYAVQEATAPHKLIPVTTGLFAAGDVQISGSGIYPGLQVTDSQG